MKIYSDKKLYFGYVALLLFAAFAVTMSGGCGGEYGGDETYYGNVLGSFPEFSPDYDDDTPPRVIQVIPPDGAVNLTPSQSIVLFFDDEIDPKTINTDTVRIYKIQDIPENRISGRFGAILSEFGNTILFFVPDQPLNEATYVYVKLPGAGIRDDGGNYLGSEKIIQFSTSDEIGAVSASNLDFEEGEEGYVFIGEGVIRGPAGVISPSLGTKMAAISTGSKTLSSSDALNHTTSLLATGAINVPPGASKLLFDYDFLSEEFDEYVDSVYDDTFIVSFSGPDDVYATLVTSVNIIGQDNSFPIGDGDIGDIPVTGVEHTGWITREVALNGVGSPINIIFCVSDVGDAAYDSIVFIDRIRFE